MGDTEALGDRHAALGGGQHHVPARFLVGTVGDGALDIGDHPADSVQGDGVDHRIDVGRQESLHAVNQRIHAGARGQLGRQGVGELGIADRHLGQHEVAADAGLPLAHLGMNAGAPRNFGAGARRGRNGDDGRRRAGDRLVVGPVVIADGAGVACHDRGALAGVDHRAAAHGHQDIAIVVLVGPGHGLDARKDRVVGTFAERDAGLTVLQGVHRLVDHTVFGEPPVGDQQGPLVAEGRQFGAKLPDGAEFDDDFAEAADDGHVAGPLNFLF